jgi:lysozyme
MSERIEYNERLLAQLKRHEGLSLEAYLCSAGHLTVGYGHNCEAWPVVHVHTVGDVITRALAEELLVEDVVGIAEDLDFKIPWWRELTLPRQGVLLNMAYNLGWPRLSGFVKFLHAVEIGDWNKAAAEMGDSKWAEQVKSRSRELITQMALGSWQEG